MTTPTRSIAGGFALMWFGLLVAGSLLALIAPLSGSEPGAGWPSDWFWVPVFGLGVSLVTSLALLIGAALAYRRPWPGRWPILLPLAPLHALSFLAMWGMGRPLAPVAGSHSRNPPSLPEIARGSSRGLGGRTEVPRPWRRCRVVRSAPISSSATTFTLGLHFRVISRK